MKLNMLLSSGHFFMLNLTSAEVTPLPPMREVHTGVSQENLVYSEQKDLESRF